ncbi:uncharacterized protein LOC126905989 [Daktulosphaira vitifoliae]|uniref:uncharacterized protein LOC126905989 n=1 Tax=Daktulosphaira vitifoliae TaxID=58002 RepID=UPI0021AA6A4E|nr:uncharacterized protein LOC126905989 [Daktulosphaira vitifoliae]
MHLKSILIFCALCFFTDTMSEGLNALHIQSFQVLVQNFNNKETVEKVLKYFGIDKEYNYNSEDNTFIRAFKILNFVAGVDKLSDNTRLAEKLDREMVENISTLFSELDIEKDGVIDGSQYNEIRKKCHHYVQRGGLIDDWKENINLKKLYELGDILLELLQYRKKLNGNMFRKIHRNCIVMFIESIKNGVSPKKKYAKYLDNTIYFYIQNRPREWYL